MLKTGKYCSTLKFMELEMHCMEMDLHFGIAEKECKTVRLRNYVYIIYVTFVRS